MQIFNIGPLELLLIVTIALIVLGPEEMVRTGRKLAKSINRFIKSPVWKSLVDTSQEIRDIPRKLMKEAELEETVNEINKMNKRIQNTAATSPYETIKKNAGILTGSGKSETLPGEVNAEKRAKLAGQTELISTGRNETEEQSDMKKQDDTLEPPDGGVL